MGESKWIECLPEVSIVASLQKVNLKYFYCTFFSYYRDDIFKHRNRDDRNEVPNDSKNHSKLTVEHIIAYRWSGCF